MSHFLRAAQAILCLIMFAFNEIVGNHATVFVLFLIWVVVLAGYLESVIHFRDWNKNWRFKL